LSFDDGPTAVETPQVLDTLERTNTAATFFVVGRNVPGNEALLRRMHQDGFEIGNHSYNHPNFANLTPEQIDYELAATQTIIEQAGVPKPALFRPPYGIINPAAADKYGLQIALWNEDPRDWQATDPAAVVAKVLGDARPGGVVDLHDIHQVTADALPTIIDQLSTQGYQFVTVSQLLHSRERPGNAPFYGYAADSYQF
jgi:peptidoglycan/xylan/chitin deacetylase (PgdA/CDA1 family)